MQMLSWLCTATILFPSIGTVCSNTKEKNCPGWDSNMYVYIYICIHVCTVVNTQYVPTCVQYVLLLGVPKQQTCMKKVFIQC